MNLGELIEHTRVVVLRDRALPSQWSDDSLTLWFNEAHDQFARRTHCLTDEDADFTQLTTEIGVSTYTLDERVVFVGEVWFSDDTQPLRSAARARMPRGVGRSKPRIFSTDAGVRKLRLNPTPDAAYDLSMYVARKPLKRLLNATDVPEIDEDYHLMLCEWVAYRALRNNDVDGSNLIEADKFRANWEVAIRDAKRDVMRYRAAPQQLNNWTGK